MPVITNFGDVVTTGNTLLQGNLTVLNTSTTLSGNLLPNVSGSSNLGQSGSQFGSAYVRTINAFSLNVTTQANVTSLNVSGTAYFANSNLAISNVTTANVSTANVGTLNVSTFASFTFANTITANITTSNVFTENVGTINVTTLSARTLNVTSASNLSSTNVTTLNAATLSATTMNVTGASNLVGVANAVTLNAATLSATTMNVTSASNLLGTTNIFTLNAATFSATTMNVTGASNLIGVANAVTLNAATLSATTLNVTSASNLLGTTNILTMNATTLSATTMNVTGASNLVGVANAVTLNAATLSATTLNVTSGSNLSTTNVTSLNVSGTAFLSNANVLTANITSANVITENVTSLNVSGTAFLSNANVLTANITTGNIVSLNVTGDANVSNLRIASNLITNNIIMSSNLSTNTGFGNVYLTGNLVVNGNIFSSGGSVGSGSGASQGILFTYAASNALPGAFSTGTVGSSVNGYHLNLTGFTPEAAQAVTQFTYNTGMLKFTTAGLYQVTCVIVGDQPAVKVAIGKTTTGTFPPSGTGTTGYDYVYNYPVGASPSEVVTLPITVTDITQYYYIDVFFSTSSGTPTLLYPTRSTTASGYNFGTYIQVAPFGNYLTSATGVASALLANCTTSSNLSGLYSSNAYRVTLTTANGWTVNGTSTSLAVTANGNFQVNQTGIYEVNLCLNTVGNTPCQFQIGSLANDTLAPGGTAPQYLYTYAPMYTQDPTTTIQMPLNITNVANVYFVECSFPGTLTGNVALSATSTFVSIKPIGGFINTGTNPWTQQGTSVYYNGGPIGLGVVPTALTETFTVSGNTSFVGNVTVTSDASSNNYVTGKRVPAGSLAVSSYVTGSVPLTTTTNLIQGYLSNTANVSTSSPTYSPAIGFAGTTSSWVQIPSQSSVISTNASNIFVEAWVYITSTAGTTNPPIAISQGGGGDDWGLRFNTTSSKLDFFVYNTGGTTYTNTFTTNFSTGSWVYVAGSFTGSNTTQYVYTFTASGSTSAAIAGNGTGTSFTGTARNQTSGQTLAIGGRTNEYLNGYIYDVRIYKGGIVPRAGFTISSATPYVFGTSQPSYITGTPTLHMSLASQYFPGASTSPYGPCLTLPGTVGSYYSQSAGTHSDWKGSGGFTLEAWVNYASLASANALVTGASQMYTIVNGQPTSTGNTWTFGATTTGALAFGWRTSTSTASMNAFVTSNTLTTGTWNHVLVQSNASNVYMAINGNFTTLTAQGFTPTGGNTTIAPTIAPSTSNTAASELSYPVTVGQFNSLTGPNVSVARARLIYGANVYSSGSFTPNPNFAPSAVAPFWQLDSQYPLPTFPSIQDVTPLALQNSSYGSTPVPVGGVTSNTLGPYSSYPAFDSIRFDGTGYIDYGNAASSALTTNLWANAWTIEGWVYPTVAAGNVFARSNLSTGVDLSIGISGGTVNLYWGSSSLVGPAISLNQWTHIAATYDGTRANVYAGGTGTSTASLGSLPFTPSYNTQIGGPTLFTGNLADVRVSNVARYTGSSYTVPTAPFTTDSNTLLLLKSLGGQVGTTLEVQGRGLNSVSLGGTRSVQSYPPAPMSSYLLDTTSNTSVTYGQGKYVASASTEYDTSGNYAAWRAYDKRSQTAGVSPSGYEWASATNYSSGNYTGSVVTVDTLGNSYAGEWLQIQTPVSVILGAYSITASSDSGSYQSPSTFYVLGSRDGTNWTLVDSRAGVSGWTNSSTQTFTASATQAYNFFRIVANKTAGSGAVPAFAIMEWILNGTEESLCITNDSKMGVGIANPQRSLEVAGDLVVGGTISGGVGMGSFRNRIINGDMRIAQRGTSNVVAGGSNYMIDRFTMSTSLASGYLTQTQQTLAASDTPYQVGFKNSLKISVNIGTSVSTWFSTTPYAYPNQNIEAYNISDLNWGTSFGSPVTLSFWFRSNVPSGSQMSFVIRNAFAGGSHWDINQPFTYTNTGTWQYITSTVQPPPNGSGWNTGSSTGIELLMCPVYSQNCSNVAIWQNVNNIGLPGSYIWPQTAGNYIEFTGVQLEKGTVATPFEFRPYATELALCQRYYYQMASPTVATTGAASQSSYFGVGFASATTSATIYMKFPVTMRNPNYTFSSSSAGNFNVSGAGISITGTSISTPSDSWSTDGARVDVGVASGLTAGQAIAVRSNGLTGSSTAYIAFSCEL